MSTTTNRLRSRKKKPKAPRGAADVAANAAQAKFEQVRENAAEYYEQGREKVHGAMCSVEQYVREQPIKSVLIGAGIGLLYGRFWMRR